MNNAQTMISGRDEKELNPLLATVAGGAVGGARSLFLDGNHAATTAEFEKANKVLFSPAEKRAMRIKTHATHILPGMALGYLSSKIANRGINKDEKK